MGCCESLEAMHRDYRSYFISLITHSLRAADVDFTTAMFEDLFFEEHYLQSVSLHGRFLDLHMTFRLRNTDVKISISESVFILIH